MERSTKEFKTSGEHTVVMYTYATGRDFNAIQACYLEGAKVNMVAGQVAVEGFDVSSDSKAKETAMKLLVASLDGDANDIVNRIMELPYEEVQEIQAELDKLTSKKKPA